MALTLLYKLVGLGVPDIYNTFIMKKLVRCLLIVVSLADTGFCYSQTSPSKEDIRTRKELAKQNMAGQIQTEITALIENTIANCIL